MVFSEGSGEEDFLPATPNPQHEANCLLNHTRGCSTASLEAADIHLNFGSTSSINTLSNSSRFLNFLFFFSLSAFNAAVLSVFCISMLLCFALLIGKSVHNIYIYIYIHIWICLCLCDSFTFPISFSFTTFSFNISYTFILTDLCFHF